jgi:SnoaL-like domain
MTAARAPGSLGRCAGDEGKIMDDIERLVIIEDLRRLMARYVYNADHQRWPDLAALFTPDGTFTPHNVDGSVALRMAGPEEIAAGIRASVGPGAVLIHHLFSDEIDVDSAASAHGVFAMEDIITRPASTDDNGQARFTSMGGYGHYRPRFTKAGGHWHIAELVLTRLRLDVAY